MKGTASRAAVPEADYFGRMSLSDSEKERAENLMIVDLMRNDLGRICRLGSVRVEQLFSVETYPTLHQMTSTICGQLNGDVTPIELISATFPAGSVTGAPKIRAMEIIGEIESEPRGVYCGCIGWFSPNNDCQLSVAIRTAVVFEDGRGEMGIGSGIVADFRFRG